MINKMTAQKFSELKRLYEDAVKNEVETFWFYGNELLVAYAKYLIEWLEPKMEGTK